MKMKRTVRLAPILMLLLGLISTDFIVNTGAKGGPNADYTVTSIIDGNGVNTVPSLRIQSDLLGAYPNSRSLQSIIQGLGDWELDMLGFTSSPQRKVLIDLRDPVPGSGPNGGDPANPFGTAGYQIVRARFISKCSQLGLNFRTMQPNNIYHCPLALAFDDASGVRYRLNQNPNNYPGTNWLQITCVATDASSQCNQWKIEPSVTQLDGQLKNVATLIKPPTKPNQSEQDLGDFYLSFTIHLTNP